MFGHRLLGIAIAVLGLGSAALAALPEPVESKPASEAIGKWIAELDSNDFSVRQQATQKLIEAGGAVVDSLLRIARSGSLEASTRAITVLEAIYTGSDVKAVDRAELALEQLTQTEKRSIAARADRVLRRHDDVRERRAVAEIRKLGGIVKYNPLQNVPKNRRREVSTIILSRKWKGRDEGLKYIKRLKTSFRLTLLRVKGDHVSDDAIKDLQISMPQLVVQERGNSYLGISGSQGRTGCHIGAVEPGTAAAKAGIKKRDVITKFGGKPVPNLEALIKLIGLTKPGDKIECVLRRGKVEKKLQVIMEEWSG